jgi:hypothetical protein
MTFTSGSVLTAAQLNQQLRDNMLETPPAKATTAGRIFVATGANAIAERAISSDYISTAQTTTSTSYANLATQGPIVTVTTGTQALVLFSCEMSNSTEGARCAVSYGVSGATTVAASDDYRISYDENSADRVIGASRVHLHTSLTAGSNNFKHLYRVSGATGTFQLREMVVIAL